jgi:hypothetical protein
MTPMENIKRAPGSCNGCKRLKASALPLSLLLDVEGQNGSSLNVYMTNPALLLARDVDQVDECVL